MNTIAKKKNKILIVDDNPNNIEVAATILSEHGYLLEFADSGEQALNWVKKEENFDLILLDIMMPGIDGFETCRQIKQFENYQDTPIIFLTAKTDAASLSKAFTSGGVDYISKPFRPDELLARVRTHVELKDSREKLNNINKVLEEKVEQRTYELKKAYNKLQTAKKEIEQLDQAKTEFLHMISHEIRTPLNGILGSISLFKTEQLNEDLATYLEILENSANRLERFSLQALEITQLQIKGEKGLDIQIFDLTKFLPPFIQEYKFEKKISEEKIILDIQSENLIKADISYLERLLKILIDNAIEYSPENKPVVIKVGVKKGKVNCTIRDHGKGFPSAMMNKAGSQYLHGIQHEDQHAGLNIQFAKILMRVFNGSFELSNATNGGAVVNLFFPAV